VRIGEGRRSGRKALLAVSAALVGIALGMSAAPTGALAATSGCGSVCDGKDPDTYLATVDGKTMRCNYVGNSYTKYTAPNVELRYSSFCRSAWARYTGPYFYRKLQIKSYYTSGSLRKTYTGTPFDGDWTAMVNDVGYLAQACVTWYESEVDEINNNPAGSACTAKF
jgi:hypothetical protein